MKYYGKFKISIDLFCLCSKEFELLIAEFCMVSSAESSLCSSKYE